MAALETLPFEIIVDIGQALLNEKPRRKHGSSVCNWARTSKKYAEILIPLIYKNALLPLVPVIEKTLDPVKFVNIFTKITVSSPPQRMWRCAVDWQSEFMLGYFSTLSLEWFTDVRFVVALAHRKDRGGSSNEYERMINKIIRSGNTNLVQLLLARGISPNEGAPLSTAIIEGRVDIANMLVKAGADISFRGESPERSNNALLCQAISLHSRSKSHEIPVFLIQNIASRGGSLEYPGSDHRTPLYHAVQQSALDLVQLLLDRGADPFTALSPTRTGHNKFKEGHGTEENISLLLFDKMLERDKHRLLGLVGADGRTPLHHAIMFQEWQVALRCIELGFDVSKRYRNGDNALHLAVRHDAPRIVKDILLAKGPDIWNEPGDTKFQDLFWWSVENSRIQGLTALKKLRDEHKITFDPAETRLGGNAIHYVCQNHKVSKNSNRIASTVIKLLLDFGISPNLQDEEYKRTPLLALLYRNPPLPFPKVVDLLLQNMSDSALDLQDQDGNTCLHIATSHADMTTVALLLPKLDPPSILLTNKLGNTALHNLQPPLQQKSCATECSHILRLLTKHNPEIIHIRDANGNTPLHMFTLWSENIENFKTLQEAGADLSALNNDDEPPYHMNSSTRSPDVTRRLLDAGADMHEKCQACRIDLQWFIGRRVERKREAALAWAQKK